jgi:hypothetical protein
MKRFLFFILLGIALTSLAFGQISITGEFGFHNIGGGNNDIIDPVITLDFNASGDTGFGPGRIGLAGELEYITSFKKADGRGGRIGNNSIAGFYSQYVNLGELKFTLKQTTDFSFWTVEPRLEYGRITAGVTTLGFGIWYGYRFHAATQQSGTSADTDTDVSFSIARHPHPEGDSGGSWGDTATTGGASTAIGQSTDTIGFYISSDFDFGLGIQYEFLYGIGYGVVRIVWLDLHYWINGWFKAGVELDNTGKEFRDFTLKPYGMFRATNYVDLGFGTYLSRINPAVSGTEVEISPFVWASFTF